MHRPSLPRDTARSVLPSLLRQQALQGLLSLVCLLPLVSAGCDQARRVPPDSAAHRGAPPRFKLAQLRSAFRSQLAAQLPLSQQVEAPTPPPEIFTRIMYPAPLGKNVAFVSPVRVGPRRPAIVWVRDGFDRGLDSSLWADAPAARDYTARSFREADIVLMLPSVRGSNTNPGKPEYFLGEVDDVLAAAQFLAGRADVDPLRIYLGGHGSGGTLALLVAESTTCFRAIFAFGPVGDISSYGTDVAAFDLHNRQERVLRSPGYFMNTILTPTFIIEGTDGNIRVFPWLRRESRRAPVRFVAVLGADHSNVLAPMSKLIAKKILSDLGDRFSMTFNDDEVDELLKLNRAPE